MRFNAEPNMSRLDGQLEFVARVTRINSKIFKLLLMFNSILFKESCLFDYEKEELLPQVIVEGF